METSTNRNGSRTLGITLAHYREPLRPSVTNSIANSSRSSFRTIRPYVERVIGTKRRKCLDHLIIFSKAALYQQVKSFVAYYHDTEHISRWPRTRWSRGPSSQQKSDGSLLSRKSAVCITGMSGAPPEKRWRRYSSAQEVRFIQHTCEREVTRSRTANTLNPVSNSPARSTF
jgi:hypothetical protein